MIDVHGLTREYGSVVAVRDVTFSVRAGQIVGFLGPNGAGKTTTLRILSGFLGPTHGSVRVLGHDVLHEPMLARRAVGYMPESTPLYPEMRVGEYLQFRAALKLVRSSERKSAVKRALALARVTEMRDTMIGHLSKGYRQRVGLADALVANPPLLILDEPTAGLDPNQIREVRDLIGELGREHTILLSTHILSEVESTCQRAIVIHKGSLVAQGSLSELVHQRTSRRVRWQLRDPESVALGLLKTLGADAVHSAPERDSGLLELETEWQEQVAEPEFNLERAVALLVEHGVGVRTVDAQKAKLEEVFSALTRVPQPEAQAPKAYAPAADAPAAEQRPQP